MRTCHRTLMPTILLLIALSGLPARAFYNPNTGRWLSRDPIAERGALNLYSFVENDTMTYFDAFGDFFVDMGQQGVDYIHSVGGRGGKQYGQTTLVVDPVFESASQCGPRCWVTDGTGTYLYHAWYIGVPVGKQQPSWTRTVQGNFTEYKTLYYITASGAAGIAKHEQGHINVAKKVFDATIGMAEATAKMYTKAEPLLFGTTERECIDELIRLVSWQRRIAEFQTQLPIEQDKYHNDPASRFTREYGPVDIALPNLPRNTRYTANTYVEGIP